MSLKVNVNGRPHRVDVPPDTPLLWVLRDALKLTGTKFGCGLGVCGACTVHLNGRAIRSCQTPIESVRGGKVTTIEGLGGRQLHPLQMAWLEEQVPQCGYCQSGQLMAAAALLAANPSPGDEEIRSTMSGNLCRCGTYPRILRAIRRVAKTPAAPKS
jgi:isoquinoline 1-oxidoreductase subunit alpha